jgi:RNA polymerase sigma factor (sigma-70 family)
VDIGSVREADLDALMSQLARGDRRAFDPLYRALRPRALGLARHKLGPNAAPDVAQAALLKVFARASEFTPGRPCLPWFYAIVGNEIQALRRHQARALALPARLAEPALAPDPETELVGRELERALAAALDDLDPDAAAAIQALLGRAPLPALPPATFRKRLSRAYAKLRLLLGGQHGA